MPEQIIPTDDNLRLILSKGHREWIENHIADARHMVKGYSVMLLFCLLWLGVAFLFPLFYSELFFLNLEEMWPAATKIIGIITFLGSFLAVILIPVSIVEIIRKSMKVREFKGFYNDHTAFLKRYRRL
jgi:hypothetical protein